MKLSQNFGLCKIMTRVSHALAICPNKAGQYMWFSIQIRQGHQMKPVLSRPVKTILTARTTHPDRWMRALYRLGKDRDVVDVIELGSEIYRLIRPRLANDLHSLVSASGGLSLVDAEFFVLMRLAAFANAEVKPAVGNHIHHRIGLRHIERIVQGQYVDGRTQTNPFRRASNCRQKGRRVRQRAAVHREMMLRNRSVGVTEAVHLFHLI